MLRGGWAQQKCAMSRFWPFLGLFSDPGDVFVRSNVSETDKEVCVTAELPGIDQKDIDARVREFIDLVNFKIN